MGKGAGMNCKQILKDIDKKLEYLKLTDLAINEIEDDLMAVKDLLEGIEAKLAFFDKPPRCC